MGSVFQFKALLNQLSVEKSGRVNRARNKRTGEIHEAHELRHLENPRADEWICPDERCRAPMAPRACEANKRWKRSAYFTSLGDHISDCRPPRSNDGSRKEEMARSISGPPVGYPSQIFLFAESARADVLAAEPETRDAGHDWSDLPHASRERSIRRACMFYAESADNHVKRLWVQGCEGSTYADCFVLLGTGGHEIVGPRRIFYGQIRLFGLAIRYDAEPLLIPLKSTVKGQDRRLLIDTSTWPQHERNDLVERIRAHIEEAQRAHLSGLKPASRAWIFFVSREKEYDQVDFHADLHPGIDTLVCQMPFQQRRFRQSYGRDRSNRARDDNFDFESQIPPAGFEQPETDLSPSSLAIIPDVVMPEPDTELREEEALEDAAGDEEMDLPDPRQVFPAIAAQPDRADDPAREVTVAQVHFPKVSGAVTEAPEPPDKMNDRAGEAAEPVPRWPSKSAIARGVRRAMAWLLG